MKSVMIGLLGLAAAAGTANANIFFEAEGNNGAGTANSLGTFGIPGGSVLVDGTITPGTPGTVGGAAGLAGDVDWFQFTITGTATNLVASIFSLNNSLADSEIYLVGANGTTILAFNDNGNVGGGSAFMSSMITANLAPGTYYVVVTGDDDSGTTVGIPALPDGFEGAQSQFSGHGESFDYKFLIGLNIVPTPGAAAVLGLGALAIGRRRR